MITLKCFKNLRETRFCELPVVVTVLPLGNFVISATKQSSSLNDFDIKSRGRMDEGGRL